MKPYFLDIVHEMSAWGHTANKEREEANIDNHSGDNLKENPDPVCTARGIERSVPLNDYAAHRVRQRL